MWLVVCFFNKVEVGYKKSDQIIEVKEGGLQSECEILQKHRIKWKILSALKMCGRVPMFLVCLTSPENLKPPSEGQKNNNSIFLYEPLFVFSFEYTEFISVFS